MPTIALLLFGLIPVASLIVGIKNKNIRWVVPVFLAYITVESAAVGLALLFPHPGGQWQGVSFTSSLSWAAFGTAGFAILLAGLSAIFGGKSARPLPGRVNWSRWALMTAGMAVGLLGTGFTLTAIYAPQVLPSVDDPLGLAVVSHLGAIALASLLLYAGSRYNNAASPNLSRWWAAGLGFFFLAHLPALIAFCLFYASPGSELHNYPRLAVLAVLGNLPLSLFFWLLAHDYLPPQAAHRYKGSK